METDSPRERTGSVEGSEGDRCDHQGRKETTAEHPGEHLAPPGGDVTTCDHGKNDPAGNACRGRTLQNRRRQEAKGHHPEESVCEAPSWKVMGIWIQTGVVSSS